MQTLGEDKSHPPSNGIREYHPEDSCNDHVSQSHHGCVEPQREKWPVSTPSEEKRDNVAFSLFPPQGPSGEEQRGVAACQEVVVLVVHLVRVLPCKSSDVEDSAFREGVQSR